MLSRASLPYAFHSRPPRRRRRGRSKPGTNRNMASAFFGLVVTGLFAVAMAEPNWFHMTGGHCNGKHLGMYPIFGLNLQKISSICLTDGIMFKLRLCFSLCLVGIITSMFQFALDVCGTTKYGLICLRRNAVGNIASVFIVVLIMALCYWITVDISRLRTGKTSIYCSLDVAFYLVAGAGISAIVAVTLSLMEITCERRAVMTSRHRGGSDMQLTLINEEVPPALDEVPQIVLPPVYQP